MIKVLIAEDEPLSLQNLTGHLRRLLGADALIEGAANGREAVDMARRIRPQLVLMDIEMPVMTGLDAAAKEMGVDVLARLPMNAEIARLCDAGEIERVVCEELEPAADVVEALLK